MDNNSQTDKINFKEYIYPILKYRFGVLLIFVMVLGATFLYLHVATPLYQTYATLEISETSTKSPSKSLLLEAITGEGPSNLDTEIDLIKSRFIISKAVDYVPYRVQYFERIGIKNVELYRNSPFKVNVILVRNANIYGVPININIINDNLFEISITPSFIDKLLHRRTKIEYHGIHKFGKKINLGWAVISISKIKNFDTDKYMFFINSKIDFVEKVRQNLDVYKTSKNSYLLNIVYLDSVPKRAKEIVNAITKAYLQQTVQLKTLEASTKLKFINKQLSQIVENLRESELKLTNFKKEHNILDLKKESQVIIQKLNDLDMKLANLKIKENAINTLYLYMEKERDLSSIPINSLGINEPVLISLIEKLNSSKLRLKQLLVEFTDKHPDVIKEKNKIRKLEKDIAIAINGLRNEIKAQKLALNKIISRYEAQMKKLPENERKYLQLKRKFLINEKIYSYLLEKKIEASIAKAATLSKNRIVDPAVEPGIPVKPKKTIIMLLGIIFGTFLGVVYSYVREFFNDKITSDEDIHRLSRFSIIGIIPKVKSKLLKKSVYVFKNPSSKFFKAFRYINMKIHLLREEKPIKTILITSVLEKEGKTITSVNFAGTLALNGYKTLIIDLNVLNPKIHEFFKLRNEKGIFEVMSNQINLIESIKKTAHKNLDIIPTGELTYSPNFFSPNSFLNLLEILKEEYDYIVIDTPPISQLNDILLLMKNIDISLSVVRVNYSKKSFVLFIEEKAKEIGIENIEYILNEATKRNITNIYEYSYIFSK